MDQADRPVERRRDVALTPPWAAVAAVVAIAAYGLGAKIAYHHEFSFANVALDALTGVAYLAAAFLLARRARSPRLVGLFVLAAGAWFLEDFVTSPLPALFVVGRICGDGFDAVFAHIALSYPSGRLTGWRDRALVAWGYLASIGLALARWLVDGGLAHDAAVGDAIRDAQIVIEAVYAPVLVAILVTRARRLPRTTGSRGTALAVGVSAAVVVVVSLYAMLEVLAVPGAIYEGTGTLVDIALLTFPGWIIGALVLADERRMRVASLAAMRPDLAELESRLRDELHDPGLRIIGPDALAGAASPGRAVLPLPGTNGRPGGYLLHDPALADDPALLDAVCMIAAAVVPAVANGDGAVIGAAEAQAARERIDLLTDRQRAVLELIARGESNAAIAGRLHLSVKTVEKHVRDLYERLELDGETARNRRVVAATIWRNAQQTGAFSHV